jgi:hypothetical protein
MLDAGRATQKILNAADPRRETPGGVESLSAQKFVSYSSQGTSKCRDGQRDCAHPLARRSEMLARHRLNSLAIFLSRAPPVAARGPLRLSQMEAGMH